MVGKRSYLIIPAFRVFNISGFNLAKTGHSSMKTKMALKLCDVARRDTASMMTQEATYAAFLNNAGSTMGKELHLRQMIQKDHDDQMKRAAHYAEVLTRGNVEEELSKDHEDACFLPSKKAKHKVPAAASSTNPTQSAKTRNKGKKDMSNNGI